MKKVFIIHGLEGSPNGGWRPWLMAELEKLNIYACSLAMPKPDFPVCHEWVEEIAHQIERCVNDEIYLVGHSLGVPAIFRYLENNSPHLGAKHPYIPQYVRMSSSVTHPKIAGAVLVSGPCEKTQNRKSDSFFETPFDYPSVKFKCPRFAIIHGDNDPYVPLHNAEILAKELDGELIIIHKG